MQKIGNYLYAGFWNSSNIKVYDISTPGNPILINTQSIETPFVSYCAFLGMTTANGYLYVVSRYTDKLYIVDVTDPLNLVVTGTLALPVNNNDIVVDGNYAYISTVDSGGPLTIVDVSNPAVPVLVSSTSLGTGGGAYYCMQVEKLGNYVYVNYFENGLTKIKVVDVSVPLTPTVVNTLNVPGNLISGDLLITGNVLYFSYTNNSTNYLRAYDLTVPSTPVFAKDIVISGVSRSITYDGQYLYLGCDVSANNYQMPGGLTVIDITTPLNPVILAQSEASYLRSMEDIVVVAGWAYAGDDYFDNLVTFPINCATDEIVNITDMELCPTNSGTTVTIPSSDLNSNYYLRDNTNDTIVDGPYSGDGNNVTFNTGVLNNSMTYNVYVEMSQFNNALNFDGSNDFVQLSNESDFDFTTNMTVEFMINTTYFDLLDGIVTKGDNSWRIHAQTTGEITFAGNGAFGDFNSVTQVNDGLWHHVAVTYDGANAKIYIDGVMENSVVATAPIDNGNYAVALGNNLQHPTRFFEGNLDEVRIWNTVRTAREINAFRGVELQGTESGLVSYYNFNQGIASGNNSTETTIFDITASGNDGVLNNYALSGITSNWVENNAVNCQFELSTTVSVAVQDTIAPVADATSLSTVTGECSIAMPTAPTATDNCSGTITGTTTTTFPITTQGTTVVTWTYDDGNGNTTTQDQNVIITDVTAPVADVTTLSDVTATCEVTSLTAPTATDNCSATVTVTNDATLPINTVGTTVVTWTYDDGNGNTSTQTQNVIITAPVIDVTTTTVGLTISANNTSATAYQWIDCNNSNAAISGETNASYTATVNGDYAVIIFEGNCSDTSNCVNINNVGIEELSDLGVSIYPNPNNGEFTLSTTANNLTVTIYSIDGKVIVNKLKVTQTNQSINLGDIETGVYFVKVMNDTNQKTIRLVVE